MSERKVAPEYRMIRAFETHDDNDIEVGICGEQINVIYSGRKDFVFSLTGEEALLLSEYLKTAEIILNG